MRHATTKVDSIHVLPAMASQHHVRCRRGGRRSRLRLIRARCLGSCQNFSDHAAREAASRTLTGGVRYAASSPDIVVQANLANGTHDRT